MFVRYTSVYEKWVHKLKDFVTKGVISDHVDRFINNSSGDISFVRDKISELRIHYGSGYRIYFSKQGKEIIILLCGGNKSTQERDIKIAKKLLKKLEAENESKVISL